jgi:dinuclear metal center YbgI/SA1388 family protein
MAERSAVESCLQALLQPQAFDDYGPNGLQVQGTPEVQRIASGVTASLAFIDAAIAAGCDTLIVHHGLFWRGQDGRLVGWLRERVARLMAHDINLFAYHLPLDAHAELGNNAQLGQRLGLQADARFGRQDLGFIGPAGGHRSAAGLAEIAAGLLGREPLLLPGDGRPLRRVAWCTGGAQGWFEDAIAAGADCYLTGEISEPQAHLARETGVAFIACGHHATERFGAQAVGGFVATQFGLEHRFIEIVGAPRRRDTAAKDRRCADCPVAGQRRHRQHRQHRQREPHRTRPLHPATARVCSAAACRPAVPSLVAEPG